MMPKQSEADASHDYLVEVLQLALDETTAEYGEAEIELLPTTYNQGILFSLLNHDGILDVVASAPTHEREVEFRAARVPLMMGLLGCRMFLIPPEDKPIYQSITKAEQLMALRACQATFWPDADIIENAGYTVVRAPDFDQLFKLLLNKECDYFPRAVIEGYAELVTFNERFPDTPLATYDDIIMQYPLAFYFYTSHANFELAARLEKGLEKAATEGKIQDLLKQSEITSHIFPLEKWRKKQYFRLPNANLPGSTPLHKKYLWIDLER